MDNRALAAKILAAVGGEKNINQFTNCVTRLRFQLKDDAKVNQTALNQLEGVLGTQFQSGQFQVILGGKVVNVANELSEMTALSDEEGTTENKGGPISNVLNTLSGILTPALPPVIAGGLLKGFVFIFLNFGWASAGSDTIIFFDGLSDAMFYFFPFLLAVSSAKKFKTNEYLALALAGLMMYPFALAEGQTMMKLFGFLPVAVVDYSASVLPIIFSVWLLKQVKRFFDQRIPEMVNMVFSPLFSLLITAPLAMGVLAPLGYYIGEYVALGIKWLIDFSPWLAGLIVGATRPIIVLGGMHHAMNPIMQQEISNFGSSQMLAMLLMSAVAQATAPLVVYFKTKDTQEKQVALSAVIPGYIGITEPAIYGVLVKYKGAMIATCLGGGVGAAVSTMLGGRSFGFVMPGLLSLPAFMGEGFMGIVIGLVVSVVVTALSTVILLDCFTKEKVEELPVAETVSAVTEIEEVASPVRGAILPLDAVSDATFSAEILGKTVLITSEDGNIYAPFAGEVKAVFPTKHAIGIESATEGIEMLIHVGLETVMLEGLGFDVHVQQGTTFKKGDLLLSFDKKVLQANGLPDVVIVVITNTEKYKTITTAPKGTIDVSDNLFTIKKFSTERGNE